MTAARAGRAAILTAVLAAALAAWPARLTAQRTPPKGQMRDVMDEDVDRAIERDVRWLYGRQLANGQWPNYTQLPAGGTTALALFALMEAGEQPGRDEIRKGLDAVCAVANANCYVRSLRIMAIAEMGGRDMPEQYRKVFLDDLRWLGRNSKANGAWTYTGADRSGDNSCSQFALLALHEAARAAEEIPQDLLLSIQRQWIARQKPDGGWTYSGQPGNLGESTMPMTAAGVASLYLIQDAIVGMNCDAPFAAQKQVDAGLKYLTDGLKPNYIDNEYLAFCIQRVGMASGRKFLGDKDWFAMGAGELVKPSPAGPSFRGQWGPDVRASLELIFLARGRIPLVFNKVIHGEPAEWDARPREVARFAEYMRRTTEERMRWQVVDINDDLRLLLDAPILLISGRKPLELTDAQWDKLREYSLRGGTLLFMPVGVDPPFLADVKTKLAGLYAAQKKDAPGCFELAQLPADHPIYTAYAKIADGPRNEPFWGVSDGTRMVALVSGADLGCTWQRYAIVQSPDHFGVGVNLFRYTTGSNTLATHMRPVFPGGDRDARETCKVAWIKHEGNWHTQPYALDYLDQKLRAENYVALDVTTGVEIGKDTLAPYRLLWFTGVGDFKLTDAQAAALRAYLDGGGTIYLDAIGGAEAFSAAAERLIRQVGYGGGAVATGLSSESMLMTGKYADRYRGLPLVKLRRAQQWRLDEPIVGGPLTAYVESDWPRILLSRYGVHDSLDGHMAWGARTYLTPSAAQVAANVVLYAMMDKPKPVPPTTQPEEGPATQPDDGGIIIPGGPASTPPDGGGIIIP